MALLVTCECGERVMADDSQAGQQMPCPACGKAVEMPQAYNPLSTAKYIQTSEPAPIEETRPAGAPCPDCIGSGQCRHCHGTGQLEEAPLERITNRINRAVTGFFTSLSDLLGAGPSAGRRRVQTRSERRLASACPSCEGRGKCFKCEGTGFAVE